MKTADRRPSPAVVRLENVSTGRNGSFGAGLRYRDEPTETAR